VNGKHEQCPLLCNPLDTASCTFPAKDRMTLLRVLQGGADPAFQMNALALEMLPQLGVSETWCRTLPTLLSHDQTDTENQIDDVLDAHLPKYGANVRKSVKEALAIATDRTQIAYPVVELLLCDDAPPLNRLTVQLALCWVHDYHLRDAQRACSAEQDMPRMKKAGNGKQRTPSMQSVCQRAMVRREDSCVVREDIRRQGADHSQTSVQQKQKDRDVSR
jgi:hypothetical protein